MQKDHHTMKRDIILVRLLLSLLEKQKQKHL